MAAMSPDQLSRTVRAIPRIVTTDEYQKALAYQAKRQARGVSPKLPQGAA